MNKRWLVGSIITALILLVAYLAIYQNIAPEESTPEVLKIGVLPDENTKALTLRYKALLSYLTETTGIQTELVIPEDYADLIDLFENGNVDLANFGGVTYLHVQRSQQTETLVMRDIDAAFSSYFVTRPMKEIRYLHSFEGARFAFGSKLSTSGHLMPRYFLEQKGVNAETFFGEVLYSGAHDLTIRWVIEGKTDIGVVNAEVLRKMIKEQQINPDDIFVLWQTPPYVDYVWAIQKSISADTKRNIRDAFLGLNKNNLLQAEILNRLGANYFLPAADSEFDSLRAIANSQGIFTQ